MNKDRFQGVFASIPTFLTENYEIRYDRMREHLNWLIEHGIREGNAVLLAATGAGEAYFLEEEEHKKTMKLLVETADGKVPTMTGLYELSARAAVRKAKYAADVGVDSLQVNPPHYTLPTDDEVYEYYKSINDAADIGIMIYNSPWCVGFEVRAPLMARLVELDNVIGAKWSSFDFGNFVDVLKKFADKINFIDNMGTVLGHMLGMKGFISDWVNFNPELDLKLWELLKKKDYLGYMKEHDRTHDWMKEVYSSLGWSSFLADGTPLKAVWEAAGLDVGPPFPPQKRIPKEDVAKIREIMLRGGILPK